MADASTLLVDGPISKSERDLIRLTERSQAPDLPKLISAGDELLWQGGHQGRGYGMALYRRLAQSYSVFHSVGGPLSDEARLAALRDDLARLPVAVFVWNTARDEARACLRECGWPLREEWLSTLGRRLEAAHRVLAVSGVRRIVWIPCLPIAAELSRVADPDQILPSQLGQLNDAAESLLSQLGVEIARIPQNVMGALEKQELSWTRNTEELLVEVLAGLLSPEVPRSTTPITPVPTAASTRAKKIGDEPKFYAVDFEARDVRPVSDAWIVDTIRQYADSAYRGVTVLSSRTGRMEPRLLEAFGGRRYAENELQRGFYQLTFDRGPRSAPKILILGDSIRMRYSGHGYIRDVYETAADDFNFLHLAHNVGSSMPLMWFRDSYLRNQPDVVLLNVGLHDILRELAPFVDDGDETEPREPNESGPRVSQKDYRLCLEWFAEAVGAYGGRLVLMTTTPVIEQVHNSEQGVQSRRFDRGRRPNLRFNADIDRYNGTMRDVAERHRLDVIDLHATIAAELFENVSRLDGVHLTRAGEIRAARAIVQYLERL